MNLQLLNNGTPSQKLWLNPVCNDLTCNVLTSPQIVGVNITPTIEPTKKLFKLGTPIGSNLPLATTDSPANTIFINNPYIVIGPLVRNGYVADFDQFILITVSYIISSPILAGSGQSNVNILQNAALTSIASRISITSAGVEQYSVCCSGVLKLAAGDQITIDFINNGFGAGWTYQNFSFSGVVL